MPRIPRRWYWPPACWRSLPVGPHVQSGRPGRPGDDRFDPPGHDGGRGHGGRRQGALESEGAGEFTFITGDILLAGVEPIRAEFRKSYSKLLSQHQTLAQKRVRLLSPDVAVVMAVGEGTYTDKAGWTSPPVGIGTTIIFVRENGVWRARHAHQSIAP